MCPSFTLVIFSKVTQSIARSEFTQKDFAVYMAMWATVNIQNTLTVAQRSWDTDVILPFQPSDILEGIDLERLCY